MEGEDEGGEFQGQQRGGGGEDVGKEEQHNWVIDRAPKCNAIVNTKKLKMCAGPFQM